ncbi:MAG: GNAT family N-acetyltransferase [Candidatus Margulisiibacteriota bacterium]
MPLNIRPALDKDHEKIKKLLKDLDLYYSGLKFKDFWAAEDNGKIVGIVQLEEFENFLFLGSLGVAPDQQKHGIAKALLYKILENHKKDVYLYTIIPDFFKKFGFQLTTPNSELITPNSKLITPNSELITPNSLPTKSRYECEYCHSDQCVTMVRHAA